MAWRRTVKGVAKKGAKKLVNKAKKRYIKGGNLKINQVIKDVSALRAMVNAEKKRIDEPLDLVYNLAQEGTGLNSSGFVVKRELFVIPEGTGHRQKNGNSIRCHSFHLDVKCSAISTIQALRAKIMLVRLKEPQLFTTSDDIISKFLVPSAFNNKYDIMSPRNYENFSDIEIVASKNVYLPGDTEPNQTSTKIFSLGGKLGFHQRTREVAGAYSSYDTNELCLIAVAERGSNSAVPIFDVIRLEFTGSLYFYDN